MITHTRRIFGTLIALAALGATSAVLRMRPAAAQTRGVLNEHIDILRRNAAALRDHDAAVLDADLTPDFVHEDALGGKTNRKGEIDALRALFRSGAWLSEAALPVRLTVQGGDANSPTVATMLVQATRTAGQRAADGHATTWDIVTIDERVLTPQGWKCRKRTDLKRAVTRDGAPYIADLTDATRPILARIQHRYDSLAIALSSGDAKAAEPLFANGAELHDLSGKPMTGQQWIDAEAHARTLGLRYDLRFAVTGISVSGATAIVTCERTAIRQATDREGVYRTTRETTTLRDTWVAGQAGWVIARSEPLLAEHDGVQPIEAAGWK